MKRLCKTFLLGAVSGFAALMSFSCMSGEWDKFPRWADTGNIANPHPEMRHTFEKDGTVVWDIEKDKYLPHYDHIEMSGLKSAVLLSYGVDETGNLVLNRHIVWPLLRTIPNNTHASLAQNFDKSWSPTITVNGQLQAEERPLQVRIRGFVEITSVTEAGVKIVRTVYPSVDKAGIFEKWELVNESGSVVQIDINGLNDTVITPKNKGVDGSYYLTAKTEFKNSTIELNENDSFSFSTFFYGQKDGVDVPEFDGKKELTARIKLVDEIFSKLQLESPDQTLNNAFNFAKLRASESIFDTKGGLLHAPGGGSYYAAIWANDQAEYVNPYFAYSGYKTGIDSAVNSYLTFLKWMKDDYSPVPSSIIAEGIDYWAGAGDRGDAAMIAYGASRFALSYGDKEVAEKLWPAIEWSLEYTKRQINSDGVIASDTDELEGRFPTGDANLCTSSLAYDAWISAAALAQELGKSSELVNEYRTNAVNLKAAINKFFGKKMGAYETYRYFAENTKLRAWICIPLTVGIYERAAGTVDALFSDRLWTVDGLKTEEGDETFWDRATLYAFRGVFAAGYPDRAFKYFKDYSYRRYLGDHVPYPVEAYPEGNQKHLSAESGLYCRIVTEGLFGLRPAGLKSFYVNPSFPEEWNEASLKNVYMHGSVVDIDVKRLDKESYEVKVIDGEKIFTVVVNQNQAELVTL
jgi:hypothetical protein